MTGSVAVDEVLILPSSSPWSGVPVMLGALCGVPLIVWGVLQYARFNVEVWITQANRRCKRYITVLREVEKRVYSQQPPFSNMNHTGNGRFLYNDIHGACCMVQFSMVIFYNGGVAERLNAAVSKTVYLFVRYEGSNPSSSASFSMHHLRKLLIKPFSAAFDSIVARLRVS